tara:strand:+ start:1124 stop:1306 length:183 start_codon:yes stop_codon:yes gene_type:complete
MDPFDKKNMDDLEKALFAEAMDLNSDAHWKPPKWIWTALITIKVAAAAALVAIAVITLNK